MKLVVLAGGSGTRLFPLSRKCFPKQFLKIAGEKSLLGQTLERFKGKVSPHDVIIVTNEAYVYQIKEVLAEADMAEANIVLEPLGRNTAPAVALAMLFCRDRLRADADEVMLVAPSDHIIEPADKFLELVEQAEILAEAGHIVTLGVQPDKPETGYGYIQAGEKMELGFKVLSFTEKPELEAAKSYLTAGNYYWNAGLFMFSLEVMRQEMQKYIPELVRFTAYEKMLAEFKSLPDISLDYAIAEKSDKAAVLPLEIYWNDIGSWDALQDVLPSDKQQNIVKGDVELLECHDTMFLSTGRMLAGIGVENLMVIETPDVVLVAKRGDSQKVKKLLDRLKAKERKEISENMTMCRPWGSYTVLNEGSTYKVKKIRVNPGQKLSLQLHYHRSEHWIVIGGTAKITVGEEEFILTENQSTYIPIAVKHRLENAGIIPLEIIEVQNGKYLGEDDIVRFEDIYGR